MRYVLMMLITLAATACGTGEEPGGGEGPIVAPEIDAADMAKSYPDLAPFYWVTPSGQRVRDGWYDVRFKFRCEDDALRQFGCVPRLKLGSINFSDDRCVKQVFTSDAPVGSIGEDGVGIHKLYRVEDPPIDVWRLELFKCTKHPQQVRVATYVGAAIQLTAADGIVP